MSEKIRPCNQCNAIPWIRYLPSNVLIIDGYENDSWKLFPVYGLRCNCPDHGMREVITMFTTKEQAIAEWNKTNGSQGPVNWVTEYLKGEPVEGDNVITLRKKP